MKKIYFLFTIWLATATAFSQSVTQPAGNGANSPSSACLACAGEVWNNEPNITALDGAVADVSLMQNGFCFQSSCFTSRSLAADQFAFSIPTTATVTGIEVNVTRKSVDGGIVRDSMVQLTNSGVPAGSIKKSPNFWDTTMTTLTYGSSSDLWGSTSSYWSPSVINGNTIGVNLKILNTATVSTQSNFVDYISMTVYYSNTTGIIESQASSPYAFAIHQKNEELEFSINPSSISENIISVMDLSGRVVLRGNFGVLSRNTQVVKLTAGSLPQGIYFAQYQCGAQMLCKKFLIN